MLKHTPVLLDESIDLLQIQTDDVVFDLTVGAGGHTRAFLDKLGENGEVVALDQDSSALELAKKSLEGYEDQLSFIHTNFENIEEVTKKLKKTPTVIFADIGMSSMHIDDEERGFSFCSDGPLDMRMNNKSTLDAAYVVNNYEEKELRDIFVHYGEESFFVAWNVAKKIILERQVKPITRTTELAEIIKKIKNKNTKQNRKQKYKRKQKGHPAQKIFQALRIHVNRELEVLERMLLSSFDILSAGGRLGVITFHSLEDRIVKKFFKSWSRDCICPKEVLQCNCKKLFPKRLEIQKPFPSNPSKEEIKRNPRSRSARLRVVKVLEF